MCKCSSKSAFPPHQPVRNICSILSAKMQFVSIYGGGFFLVSGLVIDNYE